MRWLPTLLLLIPAATAGADSARLQVTATILSRCQVAPAGVECRAAGGAAPYRVRIDGGVMTIEP